MESPSLKVFKRCVDMVLRDVVHWWTCSVTSWLDMECWVVVGLVVLHHGWA